MMLRHPKHARPKLSFISVGMPLYNAEKFVAQAIECLLAQTVANFELIISDNCSTDKTLEIVEAYAAKDKRIKIYRQSDNIGPVPNFQFVLSKAKGDYFMWRSYDDWSDDTYLEKLSSLLDQNKNIDLAVAKLVQVKDGQETFAGKDFPSHIKVGSMDGSCHLLKVSHPGWMYGMFRRTVVLNAINNVVDHFRFVWAWDHLVLFPIVSRGRVGATEETRFFQRETGISNARFRPKGAKEQVCLALNFYRICLSDYWKSDAIFFNKLIMAFILLKHTSSKTEKFTRTLRIALGLRKM